MRVLHPGQPAPDRRRAGRSCGILRRPICLGPACRPHRLVELPGLWDNRRHAHASGDLHLFGLVFAGFALIGWRVARRYGWKGLLAFLAAWSVWGYTLDHVGSALFSSSRLMVLGPGAAQESRIFSSTPPAWPPRCWPSASSAVPSGRIPWPVGKKLPLQTVQRCLKLDAQHRNITCPGWSVPRQRSSLVGQLPPQER